VLTSCDSTQRYSRQCISLLSALFIEHDIDDMNGVTVMPLYRVTKKSLCAWWCTVIVRCIEAFWSSCTSFFSKYCRITYLQSILLELKLTPKSTSSSNCIYLSKIICPRFKYDARNGLMKMDGRHKNWSSYCIVARTWTCFKLFPKHGRNLYAENSMM